MRSVRRQQFLHHPLNRLVAMRRQQRINPPVLRPRQLVPQTLPLALRELHRRARTSAISPKPRASARAEYSPTAGLPVVVTSVVAAPW